MEAATERRAPHEPRVPLDALVEVAPEGMSESFEADAVNVGPGGISMRSPILPDIGARLRCRFDSPHDGSSVDADCEVVWGHDSGPNLGEFGLRFRQLDSDDAEAIRRLVDSWHSALDPTGGPSEPQLVSLRLEGVAQAVEAELVHRAADVLVVEQPLPFLRVGAGVEEGGRCGWLESVDLRMDGETPRLVLTVGYEASSAGAPVGEVGEVDPESTLLDAPAPSTEHEPSEAPRVADGEAAVHEALGEPFSVGSALAEDDTGEVLVPPQAQSAVSVGVSASGGLGEIADELADSVDEAQAAVAFRSSARTELRKAVVFARRQALQLRLWLVAVWSKAAPMLRGWWARMRHSAGGFGRRAASWTRELRARAQKRARGPKRPAAKRATRTPKRRTTRPPSKREAGGGGRRRPRLRLRWVLLGSAVVVGAAFAFSGSTVAPVELASKPLKPEPELGDTGGALVEATEAPLAPAAEPAEPAASAQGSAATEPPEPQMPRAMPDAPRGAGRIPPPSFPSVGGARPSAPGTVPSDSPYAVGPTGAVATSFGLDQVPGGQQFRIRLSRPARELRGEATDDGFRVVIEGANATEGARRIASVHPDVERARIENDGERALLTVRFVGERRPPYRVHTAGTALFVTLGR